MDKVPLLLFSGGMDSTYMLQEALKDGDVETIYVSASQSPDKIKKELEQREKIFAKLKRLYPNHRVRRDRTIVLNHVIDGSMPDHKFVQPMLWLHAAMAVVDHERHSELRIGYVNGDSICAHLYDIRTAWESLSRFSKWHYVPLEFPLLFTKKQTILRSLHPQLYKDIWVCEIPKPHGKHLRACGRCEPCLTHASMLFVYERLEGKSFKEYQAQILPSYRLPAKPRERTLALDLSKSTPIALTLTEDVKLQPEKRKRNGSRKNGTAVVRGDELRTRGIGRPDFGRT